MSAQAAYPFLELLPFDDALRAAVNVLRDSAESGRMPSGEPLDATAAALHEAAANRLAGRIGVR